MITLATILSILAAVLLYALFAPIYLEVDSKRFCLEIRFHRLASATFQFSDRPILITRFLYWRKDIQISNDGQPFAHSTQKKIKSGKHIDPSALLRVIRSFRIKRCHINIDIGDMQFNGITYPVLWWFKWRKGLDTNINFTGRNEINLQLKNNIARMVWAYMG